MLFCYFFKFLNLKLLSLTYYISDFNFSGQPVLQNGNPRIRIETLDASNTIFGTQPRQIQGHPVFGSILTITSLQMNDTGNYSCVAQNMFGSEEITYFLEVKRKFYFYFYLVLVNSHISLKLLINWKINNIIR